MQKVFCFVVFFLFFFFVCLFVAFAFFLKCIFLYGHHFLCFHLNGGYVFFCSMADNLGQLSGCDGLSSFCPEMLLAICRSEVCVLQGLHILCCRKGSHSQHCTEDLVMHVKEDAAARPAC